MSSFGRLQGRAHRNSIPLNVTLEITLRCNLRCVHCYNFDRGQPYLPGREAREELSDDEIHRIIDEVKAEGCLFLAFTGGEALVHPGLVDFVAYARSIGLFPRLKSNGILLEGPRVRRLAAAGAAAVDISLYGARAGTHDAFVMRSGAFDMTIRGLQTARDAGMEVKLNIILTRANADQMQEMIDLCESMSVPWNVDPQVTDRYDGTRFPNAMRLDRETLEKLYRGPLRARVLLGDPHPDSVQCSCARSVCGISAFGDVYPCIAAPMKAGSLRESSFHDIWVGSPVLNWIRGLTLEDFAACRACDHRAFCRRSSGVIFTNTGNYTGPDRFGDDWVCMEAELTHQLIDESSAAQPDPVSP